MIMFWPTRGPDFFDVTQFISAAVSGLQEVLLLSTFLSKVSSITIFRVGLMAVLWFL